jgi:hypothetical protein
VEEQMQVYRDPQFRQAFRKELEKPRIFLVVGSDWK